MMDLFLRPTVFRFDGVANLPTLPRRTTAAAVTQLGLVKDYFATKVKVDFTTSAVIGDRQTDLELAEETMGIAGIRYECGRHIGWAQNR